MMVPHDGGSSTPTSASAQLAIILPTYRFDAGARQALRKAASIGCSDILVHIADNSENPAKHKFLGELAARSKNVVVTCHSKNIGAHANWMFLVTSQTAPFLCLAADDDSFDENYFRSGLKIMLEDEACSAAHGLHISFAGKADQDGLSLHSPSQRIETTPLDRIRCYRDQNSLAYAVIRTPVAKGFMSYLEQSPIRSSFEDYLLAFHLLSIGTYRLDRSGYVYVYDDTNWHLPDASFKSYAHYYKLSGLPESFAHLGQLHWAVCNLHFFRSRFRAEALTSDTAATISTYLFDRYRNNFRAELAKHRGVIATLFRDHPRAAAALRSIIDSDGKRVLPVLDDFAHVVAAFSPEISARLRDFQGATLMQDALSEAKSADSIGRRLLSWAARRR